MDLLNPQYLLNSLVYSILGIAVFWIAFVIIDKLTPYDLWRELVEERNTALAIVIAAMCLGLALIIASAIHG
ncbi:DUF350 domain-containing protein [Sulfuriferula thiophila]|uniref:DUF350 domain-containing protein n=1 Tax=Sulfuriferula thiophila TaxID=1781211 RepID=UPI000F614C1F|nr:DUF350 domain-containing protein [Sulfuriferula thiophila]